MFSTHQYSRLPSTTAPSPARPAIHRKRRRVPSANQAILILGGLLLISFGIIASVHLTGSMRLCLPFSLSRVSTTAHQRLSCQAYSAVSQSYSGMSTNASTTPGQMQGSTGSRLADFLVSQRDTFLDDVSKGRGKGWVVAMGNEAGDLDSLASSVAYAYLSSTLSAARSVPILLTPSSLMRLRPENLLALQLAHVPPTALLHPDTLPLPTSALPDSGVEFALVDHNSLLPLFGTGRVAAIIDHHSDEGRHTDANTRVITVPTGSCASLVTKHFLDLWQAAASSPGGGPVDPQLATLLLSAILIDTQGLKEGGKATADDRTSAAFLYSISTLKDQSAQELLSTTLNGNDGDLQTIADKLLQAKFDVNDLSTTDLLLRDYKEYMLPTASNSYPHLKVGLSTVPLGLKKWLGKEPDGWASWLAATAAYMQERNLDVEGVLTTYRSDKGHGRRELALFVRSGGDLRTSEDVNRVLQALIEGCQQSQELQVAPWTKKGLTGALDAAGIVSYDQTGMKGIVWQQENTKATRKQVAPLVRELISRIQ